jgi:hypothetical protein
MDEINPSPKDHTMPVKFSSEQRDLLRQMLAIASLDHLVASQEASAEALADVLVASTAKLADEGHDEARSLMASWAMWERYERLLNAGRHDAVEAVTMMLYDAGKTISSGASA